MGLLHFCMLLTNFKNTFQIFFEESLRQCESISKMFILGEISHAQKKSNITLTYKTVLFPFFGLQELLLSCALNQNKNFSVPA